MAIEYENGNATCIKVKPKIIEGVPKYTAPFENLNSLHRVKSIIIFDCNDKFINVYTIFYLLSFTVALSGRQY